MNKKDIKKLKELAKPYFKKGDSDRWMHTLRVLDIARFLQKKEGGNLDVIEAAAILHDIALSRTWKEGDGESKGLCHAAESSKLAEQILKKEGFSEDKIKKIKHCIEVHRWSKGLKPKTIEAQIIKDADRIDAIGAVGLARAFDYGAYNGRPLISKTEFSTLDHIKKKLTKIDADSVGTKTAKKIIKNRHNFVVLFAEQFEKELKGAK